jgi:copper chaperone CopZ
MANDLGEQVHFTVGGMHCENCAAGISRALREQEGVITSQVNLAEGAAVVTYDPKKVAPAELKALVEDLGYTVAEMV